MNQEKIKELEEMISRDYGNTAGIIIQKNGKRIYEKYFSGNTADNAIHVCSVTKSIFSALIGIAIDKGYIKSVDQKVLDFFPNYIAKTDENTIRDITIKNLLTMTAPYKYESEPYEEFFASADWVEAALSLLGGDGHIGEFKYSPIIGTHILSGILVKATGQSVLDFAKENLFTPLGIDDMYNVVLHNKEEQIAWYTKEKNSRGWVADPQGINTASWGLTLTPADMAIIGQLYLNGGMWDGKQIIPAWWIDDSTKEHSRWGMLSYGYLWWVLDDNERIYAALGDGGNVIYINAKRKLVVSIACFFAPDAKDRVELIKAYIEPIFENY